MDTTYLRERLAHQVAGEVYAGTHPPPPLATVAPGVAARVVEAVRSWRTGSALVNLLGHGESESPWAPEVLDRLRAVKAAVDRHDLFGGVVSASAAALAGAR